VDSSDSEWMAEGHLPLQETPSSVWPEGQANKLLRFAKKNKEVTMHFPSFEGTIATWNDLGFLALSDAAWAARPDGSSQGGMMVLILLKTAFDDKSVEYAMLDWRSWKLARVARSSLNNAETQAAAEAADALEYVKTFWNLLHQPDQHVMASSLRTACPSALAIDAKSMYDAVKKDTAIQSASCKRTAVELVVLKQTLRQTGSVLRWVSSERQMADGLTKISARQLFAERLAHQVYRLVYDVSFTAAKKKNLEDHRRSEREGINGSSVQTNPVEPLYMLSDMTEVPGADDDGDNDDGSHQGQYGQGGRDYYYYHKNNNGDMDNGWKPTRRGRRGGKRRRKKQLGHEAALKVGKRTGDCWLFSVGRATTIATACYQSFQVANATDVVTWNPVTEGAKERSGSTSSMILGYLAIFICGALLAKLWQYATALKHRLFKPVMHSKGVQTDPTMMTFWTTATPGCLHWQENCAALDRRTKIQRNTCLRCG